MNIQTLHTTAIDTPNGIITFSKEGNNLIVKFRSHHLLIKSNKFTVKGFFSYPDNLIVKVYNDTMLYRAVCVKTGNIIDQCCWGQKLNSNQFNVAWELSDTIIETKPLIGCDLPPVKPQEPKKPSKFAGKIKPFNS